MCYACYVHGYEKVLVAPTMAGVDVCGSSDDPYAGVDVPCGDADALGLRGYVECELYVAECSWASEWPEYVVADALGYAEDLGCVAGVGDSESAVGYGSVPGYPDRTADGYACRSSASAVG